MLEQKGKCSLSWALMKVKDAVEEGFTGNMQINFFKGGISNINRVESIIEAPQPQKEEGSK